MHARILPVWASRNCIRRLSSQQRPCLRQFSNAAVWHNTKQEHPPSINSTNANQLLDHQTASAAKNSHQSGSGSGRQQKPSGGRARKLFFYGVAMGLAYYVGQQTGSYLQERKIGHKFAEKSCSPEYAYLAQHPMVQELRSNPDYTETFYTEMVPQYHHQFMVTLGTLSGQGLLTVEPLVFTSKDAKFMYIFYHVGDKVLHHTKRNPEHTNKPDHSTSWTNWIPSLFASQPTTVTSAVTPLPADNAVVHTGLMTTLMDEGLSRCAFPSLPSKYGVTASLELDFQRPLPPDSFLLLRAEATKAEGRKSWAEGTLEVLTPQTSTTVASLPIIEGRVLMVEPKWAKYLVWMFK